VRPSDPRPGTLAHHAAGAARFCKMLQKEGDITVATIYIERHEM
jgi:hypothetical protein